MPDDPNSKVSVCSEKIFNVWEESTEIKGTQILFCDLSTPKGKKIKAIVEDENQDDKDEQGENSVDDEEISTDAFTVYQDVKDKLVKKGILDSEIKFIHEALST